MSDISEKVKNEGDHHEFNYRGFRCSMSRNAVSTWCGYIDIPSDYDVDINHIHVRGCITYDQVDGDIRTIGFDCAHAGDRVPFYDHIGLYDSGIYRDKQFVIGELRSVVDQLMNIDFFIRYSRNKTLKFLKE